MRKKLLLTTIFILAVAATAFGQTTIEWWQFWTDPNVRPAIQRMVSEFEQANPDIKVKLTDLTWSHGHEKIVVALASGAGPDVLELGSDWIAQFASSEQLADISSHIKKDSADSRGWGMSTYQGKVFAKPWILGTRVLFYNHDLMTGAGFSPDFVPVTLKEFEDVVKKIDDKHGADVYGWGSNTAEKHRLYKKFLPFFWSNGAQIFTDDNKYCVISSTYAVDALSQYQRLHQSGYVGTQREIEDAFLDGKIGVILSGEWLLKRIALEKRKVNLMTALFPGPQFPGRSFEGAEFLAVNEASGHKAEALKFIDFMTSPENQLRFCQANLSANPSSKKAQEDPFFESNKHLRTFVKQIKSANHPPVDPDWVYMEDVIEQAVESVLFGGELPGNALRKAQLKITEIKNKK